MRNPTETIGKLIDHASTCYIAYIDNDGFPVTKAMLKPRERNGIGEIWFSTNTSSNKVACFRKCSKASVYFVDRRFFRGASLVGTMEVIEDASEKERIWRDGDEMFYPKGITDPDFCVLKFRAQKCRFYGNFHSEDIDIL